MFEPVSAIEYDFCARDRQILVCLLDEPATWEKKEKWCARAAAMFNFRAGDDLVDVLRDLLANPQIRAVVFDGNEDGLGRNAFLAFWDRSWTPVTIGPIKEEHLEVVRQFVNLYDGECMIRKDLPPFWPERLIYKESECPKNG